MIQYNIYIILSLYIYIFSFWGAFFHDNEIYISTEYLDGGSLDRYKPIPEPELGRMSVMVVHGLQYLWSMGIMHRDVKPSNMLVNTAGYIFYFIVTHMYISTHNAHSFLSFHA